MPEQDSAPEQTVYDEIKAERERQDQHWGGPEHDDKHHTDLEWSYLVADANHQAITTRVYGLPQSGKDWRTRMLQVAALAVAGIEAYDRKVGQPR